MTLVYLDTETTGLDPATHEVWEIAYAVGDGLIEASCVRHDLRTADPAALKVGRYRDRVRRGEGWWHSADDWETDLKIDLDGAIIVGASPAFDAAFLRARWGVAPWHYRLFDIEVYAMPALGLDEPRGLAYIAEQLGVEAPDHSAAGDVRALRGCHRALVERYREVPR